MTCMFPVALTMGGPIRRQAAQPEKTVPIGGNVTLLCPHFPNDTSVWVYWKKNDLTVYSLEVKSNTPWTNDTRYEGRDHATRLTIKDLKKTDSGIYHCKVATLLFIKERGHVLLSVTDQEIGLSTTSPGVPSRAPTTIPLQAANFSIISVAFSISLLFNIIIITLCLIFKYRKQFPRDTNTLRNIPEPPPTENQTSSFTIEEVKAAIKALKNNKTSGFDNISAETLKAGGPAMAQILLKIINTAFTQGKTPVKWSKGLITPVHKKGDKQTRLTTEP
ncbi:uncharacterized protein LOC115927897 [Strongylocentrotus purpuratus]|uniref:Ig-like domain-containing protein n=1 Tax=Strongylocentrotus purpuratus TaxID=7668 RepID=A0A7M7PE28_STRPU|nr:uncharacterized protein LOC115927897 [Strongylocentrotus purpuratus]